MSTVRTPARDRDLLAFAAVSTGNGTTATQAGVTYERARILVDAELLREAGILHTNQRGRPARTYKLTRAGASRVSVLKRHASKQAEQPAEAVAA